ncbi:unnamed protein product [Rangifer tarandus platyrhynchus]|uniref:Uncharacterized protein n=1 Tax=Rangifer tarandus platyrhynchus TaxID=3082113 RepID=A0ABN8Y4P0_RANTA|nr:unnamed protein product [Rangifer tarandus platyrhynchus]
MKGEFGIKKPINSRTVPDIHYSPCCSETSDGGGSAAQHRAPHSEEETGAPIEAAQGPPKGPGRRSPRRAEVWAAGTLPTQPGRQSPNPSRMANSDRETPTGVRGRGAWPDLRGLPIRSLREPKKKTRASSQGGHKAPGDRSKDPDRSRHRGSKVKIPSPLLIPELSFPPSKADFAV